MIVLFVPSQCSVLFGVFMNHICSCVTSYAFAGCPVVMSHCEEPDPRHKVIFLTKEDADPATSKVTLPEDGPDDERPGLIQPNGEINWSCPCLGGMPVGPCGLEFRAAFECFHYR